jgi:hypothetical protein
MIGPSVVCEKELFFVRVSRTLPFVGVLEPDPERLPLPKSSSEGKSFKTRQNSGMFLKIKKFKHDH